MILSKTPAFFYVPSNNILARQVLLLNDTVWPTVIKYIATYYLLCDCTYI